jgi:hypothetical protein
MEQSAPVAADRLVDAIDDPARRPLIIVSVAGLVAVVTGTFMYSYPTTLEALQSGMVLVHDASGDVTLAAGAWYLFIHLKRVWRMWRRVLQRWSGYFAVLVWVVAGGTGIYGQLEPMPSTSTAGLVHIVSSIAAVVLGCFHGGYGLRRKMR